MTTVDKQKAENANNLGRFAALAFCRADILFQVTDELKIKFCTGPAKSFLGKDGSELIGLSFLDIVHPDDHKVINEYFLTGSKNSRVDDLIVRGHTASGIDPEIAISGYRVPDFDNDYFLAVKIAPKQTIPIGRDPKDRDESGVLNNEAFVDAAAQRVRSYEAAGGTPKVSMVNIGDLSEAGIEEGSAEANKVLQAIGQALSSESLGGDTAGRIDDESFSVVHGEDVDVAELSQKVSNALSQAAPNAKNFMPKIATMDASSKGMDDKQLAKAMMYSLQEFTKNDGELPEGDLTSMLEKQMEQSVKDIERFRKICDVGSFNLVYMPVASLKDGSTHHFEALTRFHDDAGASPFQLITLAEEVGVISEFDIAVAERALKTVNAAKETGNPVIPVAINVSGHSISDPKFCELLQELLTEKFGVEEMISLEITESAEIKDLQGVNDAIQKFRRVGFKVALDDFGAGAASFDYLNSFDVDTVKFDGPVVKRAVLTKKGKAFLASMATLCHEIEVETIAEMVEDQALADFLKQCGIELGQGWHFGKPMPTEEAFPGIAMEAVQKPAAAPKPAADDSGKSLLERLSSGQV